MDLLEIVLTSLRVALGPTAAAFAVAAIGLNVHFGHTGLLNFGQAGFMLVGAYGVAVTVDQGWSLPVGLPGVSSDMETLLLGVVVGVAVAVVLALLLGLPTLRLRADYLAIATIATAEILRLLVRADTWASATGGAFGIDGVNGAFRDTNPISQGQYGWSDLVFSDHALWVMVVGWGLALACTLLVWRLMASPWGRALRAVREDEDAARSLGKNVFALKMQSLVLGGVLGAFGGMISLLDQGSVSPDIFQPQRTFFLYAMVILGGTASTWGPVVGAGLYWFFVEASVRIIDGLIDLGWIPTSIVDSQDLAAIRFVIVGLLVAGLMIFRPQGLFGNREEIRLDVR